MVVSQISGPNSVLDKTFRVASGQTITGYQAVKLASQGGEIALTSAASDRVIGVTQVDPGEGISYGAGRHVPVRLMGITKVVTRGAVVSGSLVVPVANGYGAVDDGGSTGNTVVGIALESAWTHGQLINVLLTPGVHIA